MRKQNLLSVLFLCVCVSASAQRYLTPQFTDVKVTKDVVFGQNYSFTSSFLNLDDLKMDVYEPDGDTAASRPVVILGHAGSYLTLYPWGKKEQYSVVELCNRFAKLGYVAVSIDYRIGWAPLSNDEKEREKTIINAVYRAMLDFKTCIRYFKKDATDGSNQWNVNPCQIFIGGTNSGGYSALACGSLNNQSELNGVRFLDAQGNPYINQSKTGDFDGFGGTENYDNHVGYNSTARCILALGAATGDTTWIEQGETPVIAFQGTLETTTPYNRAIVITSSGTAIIRVDGSGNYMPRVERLGNNDVFKNAGLPQGPANINGNGQVTVPVDGLYPFYGQKFEPWSWYDPDGGNQPMGEATLNPGASQAKALLYIDTIMSYTAPRFYEFLKDQTPCQVTTSIKNLDKKSDVNFTTVPNPSSNTLTIFSSSFETNIISVTISDFNGRTVRKIENNEDYFAVVNVEDLANGMYAVAITTKDGVQAIRKVIVQH